MTVAFLTTRRDKPSARYRVLQYIPYLERAGCEAEVFIIPVNPWGRLQLFTRMKRYDVVVLQKKLLDLVGFTVLRKSVRALVYDFDDAVMFTDSQGGARTSARRGRRFFRTVRHADAVIAGNAYLRDFSLAAGTNTVVIPTPVDTTVYTPRSERDTRAGVTVGWIGSRATIAYLAGLKSVLKAVNGLYPQVRFKIVADRFPDIGDVRVTKKRWAAEEELEDLRSFDIGLMPLTDDPWSRGKCGFKLLQYMAVGIPSICSPVGVNKEIVKEGVNGFTADNDDEWIRKLGVLINDAPLRIDMGKKARETVIRRYSLEENVKRLVALFETLRKDAAAGAV